VLVLFGGSAVALGEAEDLVDAVIQVWYPGEEGGHAVADILFGKVSPSGKLPITFPKATSQLPPFQDYSMKERTYRYATWEPLYPFGFGLSYTSFVYSALTLPGETLPAGESLPVRLTVTNTGAVDAEEVVQLYISDLEASVTVPQHRLAAFQRVSLKAGECREVAFTLSPEAMMLFDEDGKQQLEPGEFRLIAGGCSPSARGLALGAAEPVSATFRVG
jgi:beta-glucosidase